MRAAFLAIAAASMSASSMLTPIEPVQAQIPAFLPTKDSVPQAEAMEIDGDWLVNTINKVIRIERGRAYAVEGWTHAFVLQVQPDMVTIRNIRQTGDGEYVGDDLPLMGKVTLRHVSPDRIEASVPGMFGPIRYTLTRVSTDRANDWSEDPTFVSADEAPPSARYNDAGAAPPRPEQKFASLDEAFGPLRRVSETYRGCPVPDNPSPKDGSSQASPRDRVTGREFAPVVEEEPAPETDAACWTRLDGVWVQNREAIFDTAANDGRAWEVENSPLAGLLHGNYTTPETLFIAPGDTPDELFLMSGVNGVRFARYVASDDLPVADLIGNPGISKQFDAVGDAAYGERLLLDYTAGGELRIRLGRRQFLRPDPAISSDLSIDDAFVIQFQTDNFAANLKGYNVLTQDPFLLMNNNLGEVFARRDREEYRIQEKYAVPFGFTLRNETLQGNVYRRTVLSSERQIQEANRTSLGLNANISVSGAVNSALAFVPGTGEIADTGFSVGNQSSRETMRAMQSSQTVAQVVGYSRAKSYAIVAEHADTELSGDFITAVYDAKNDGDYSAIINRFGTHYAYAVTYGASAKMTQDISEEAFSTILSESEGERQDAELRVLGSSLGMFNESMRSGLNGTSGQLGNEGGRFVAIGGNGSWDAGGYAKGDRVAPILVDLRPLDELLNPINFPDQPEIYTRIRFELAQSINRYLARQARPLSNERIISKVAYIPPAPEPAPIVKEGPDIEEWLVYVRHMDCRKPKLGTTTSASGDITISAVGPSNAFSQPRTLSVGCKYKEKKRNTFSYRSSPNTPGLLMLSGTREQMQQHLLKLDFNWYYDGTVKGKDRTSNTSLNSTALQTGGLAVGTSKDTKWVVRNGKQPELTLYVRVKRIK